jgi:hypothetical protein
MMKKERKLERRTREEGREREEYKTGRMNNKRQR